MREIVACFGAVLSLALSPSAVNSRVDEAYVQHPHVKQVFCPKSRGTAFRIGPTKFVSVAHVTDEDGCTIDGKTFTEADEYALDFTIITSPIRKAGGLKIDCSGYKPGKWYWAVGYAFGVPIQSNIAAYATHHKLPNGMRVLTGGRMFIPGMSGGPVIDPETGLIVGVVNAYNPFFVVSFSREMKDTSLCSASARP